MGSYPDIVFLFQPIFIYAIKDRVANNDHVFSNLLFYSDSLFQSMDFTDEGSGIGWLASKYSIILWVFSDQHNDTFAECTSLTVPTVSELVSYVLFVVMWLN